MEDLTKEMLPHKPVSPKMRGLLDKEKREARKRIIDRGIIHFRADEEFMASLLDAAEHLKIAPGTLCRRIVWDHLKSLHSPSAPEISRAELLPNVNEDLMRRLETIQQLLSQNLTSRPSKTGADQSLAFDTLKDLRSGQDAIHGELQAIHACLLGTSKKSKHRST